MVALTDQRVTTEALQQLAAALESLQFGPDAASLAADRDRLAGTIRSYLIPRVIDPDLPMTVVVAGPTGSGKSTVVNSLCGSDVSTTGALRPTTRKPVVVGSPGRVSAYETIGGLRCETVAVETPLVEDMVLVDTPDVDSTSTRHRAMAEILIDNADVVVFVTSSLRYADEVPWQILRRARSRGAPVIHVLNRVASQLSGSVVDFRSKLAAAGMDDDLIVISEYHLADGVHRVPSVTVQSLHHRLLEVASRRGVIAGEMFRHVLSATLSQVIELIDTVSKFQIDIDTFETTMSELLVGRIPGLLFDDVGVDLYPAPPARSSPGPMRRWKKRAAAGPEYQKALPMVIERMATVVTSDIRQFLVEERAALNQRGINSAIIIEDTTTAVRSAIAGWLDYVTRIAADFNEADAWLGKAVLIHAATSGESISAVDVIFGDTGPIPVDRARRELEGRLEVAYQLAATIMTDILRNRFGDCDETDLRASVGAVTATLVPVHA